MSLNLPQLKPIEVRDPRTIAKEMHNYPVMKGASQVTYKQYTTTSISNSSLQYSCPPPSANYFVDRKIYHYVPVRLTFTGVPPNGQTLLQPNRDAPRQYGLSQAVDTYNLTINNYSTSVNSADITSALLRYNNDNLLKNHQYSCTPSYPDQSQLYSSLVGSIRNPLAGYGDSTDESLQSRGGFENYFIISNPVSNGVNSVTAVVDIAFMEPLFLLSPAYWGHEETHPFIHVNTIDLNVTFLNQAVNRFWSRDETNTPLTSLSYVMGGLANGPTSFGNTTGNQPLLLFCYLSPQETQDIPRNMPLSYRFYDIQRFTTDIGSIGAGSSAVVQSNNVQLSSIPRKMFVFARKRNNDLFASPTNTDTFLQIQKVNIQYMNKTGLLNSANMNQLYQISQKNGCSMSWTQWSGGPVYASGSFSQSYGTVGSILCLNFGEDIGLQSLQSAGKLEHNTLQVEVTLANTSSAQINASLYIVVINEGVYNIMNVGDSQAKIGVLSSQDILDASQEGHYNYADLRDWQGGDFLGDVKQFFTSTIPKLLQQSKLASNLATLVPVVGPQLSKSIRNLGYGEGEGEGGEGEGISLGGEAMRRHKMKQHAKRTIML